MNKNKLISFYANTPSQGLRTISLAFSNLLAQQSHSVLYVDLDTVKPSIAKALQIKTGKKNIFDYFERTIEGDFDSVDQFILTKAEIINQSERKQKSYYSGLEKDVSFLIAPMETPDEDIPDLIDHEHRQQESIEEYVMDYVSRFVETLTGAGFDYVICKLPNDIDHMFTYEMMKHSDQVISVATPSITKLIDQTEAKQFLFEQNKALEEKWTDILNMTSQEVPNNEYKALLDTEFIIPFDPERIGEEMALQPDSPFIRRSLEQVVQKLGIPITLTVEEEKTTFFQRIFRGKG